MQPISCAAAPLDERRTAARRQHVVDERHDVAALDRVGEQQRADLRRRHDHVGARLPQLPLVQVLLDPYDDLRIGRDAAHRQREQDRGRIVGDRDDDRLRAAHLRLLQQILVRGVAAKPRHAERGGRLERLLLRIDDDQRRRIDAALEQFAHGDRAAQPVAANHDVIAQILLQAFHAVFLDDSLNHELISGAEKDEPDTDADRHDEECIDETRARGDGHDVAVADRRDRHHREVHEIGDAHRLALRRIAQAVAIEIEHEERERAQADDEREAQRQRAQRRRGGPREQRARARRLPRRARAAQAKSQRFAVFGWRRQ